MLICSLLWEGKKATSYWITSSLCLLHTSHAQATGGDQSNAIYLELQALGFKASWRALLHMHSYCPWPLIPFVHNPFFVFLGLVCGNPSVADAQVWYGESAALLLDAILF